MHKIFCLGLFIASVGCKDQPESARPIAPQVNSNINTEVFCASLQNPAPIIAVDGFTASAEQLFLVKIDWSLPLVAVTQPNQAKVSFIGPQGQAAPLTLSSFQLFMPSMGHGSIKTKLMKMSQDPKAPYTWQIDSVYFSMGGSAGEWVVDLEASACDRTDRARVIIPLPID
jgi:hypothetical protein